MSTPSRLSSLSFPLVLFLLLALTLRAYADESEIREPDSTPPETAVLLRFQWSAPLRYEINNQTTTTFEERPDLRQVFSTRMVIDYQPLSPIHRQVLPSWPFPERTGPTAPTSDQNHRNGSYLLSRVQEVSSGFDEPEELTAPQNTYQLLTNATFSFHITPRGLIEDPRIHPPTSPLLQANMRELLRLLSHSHPLLPEEPVAPGAQWTDTTRFSLDEDSIQKILELRFTYTFEQWVPCEDTWCAVIQVDQQIQATGLILAGQRELRNTAEGRAEGRIVFHPEEGRVLHSRWRLSLSGTSRGIEDQDDLLREIHHSRYHTEVDALTELLHDSGGQDLTTSPQDQQ